MEQVDLIALQSNLHAGVNESAQGSGRKNADTVSKPLRRSSSIRSFFESIKQTGRCISKLRTRLEAP
jgi:hypothetical protein